MITKGTMWTGLSVLVLGAVLSAAPVHVSFDPDTGLQLGAAAFAKDGDDDDGGNSGSGGGGGGSDDSGGDDDDDDSGGGNSGRGGGDDDDSGGSGGSDDDDSSGSGSGSDDDDDDDGGRGRGRGGDDDGRDDRGGDDRDVGAITRGTVGTAGGGSGLRVVKVEQGAGVTEITYSNGVKEEIENGRYEQKDAAGRTVAERPATQADLRRIAANVRNSGIVLPRPGAGATSQVSSVEVGGGAIEVRYATGWKEELEAGRYELKDPNDNTVVERPATAADRRRMQALAGG